MTHKLYDKEIARLTVGALLITSFLLFAVMMSLDALLNWLVTIAQ